MSRYSSAPETHPTSVRIKRDLYNELSKYSRKKDRSINKLMNDALEVAFEKWENESQSGVKVYID